MDILFVMINESMIIFLLNWKCIRKEKQISYLHLRTFTANEERNNEKDDGIMN